jgi:hypothetical protein
MLGTVLVFALLAATDPIRIGVAVLLISRPRPLLNLLAFWVGGMLTGVGVAVGVLLVLRNVVPLIGQEVAATAASPAVRSLQLAMGAVAILAAIVIGSGVRVGQRMRRPPTPVGSPSQPHALARMSARLSRALEGGSPTIAFAAGLVSATPPVECLIVLAAITASGAAIGAQIAAAVLFTVLTFAIVEIPLVGFLVAPTTTFALVLRVQQWAQARRRRILALLMGLSGVFLMSAGL